LIYGVLNISVGFVNSICGIWLIYVINCLVLYVRADLCS